MRKVWFIPIIILIILMLGFGASGLDFGWHWEPVHCTICGKLIYTLVIDWVEGAKEKTVWKPLINCPGEMAEFVEFQVSIPLCGTCYEKYESEIQGLLQTSLDNWLKIKVEEYKPIREQYQLEELKARIKSKENEITNLKRDLEDWGKKLKETKSEEGARLLRNEITRLEKKIINSEVELEELRLKISSKTGD